MNLGRLLLPCSALLCSEHRFCSDLHSCQHCSQRQDSDFSQLCAATEWTHCRSLGSTWASFKLVQESAKPTESYAICFPQSHEPLRMKQLPLLQHHFVACFWSCVTHSHVPPCTQLSYPCNFFVPVSLSPGNAEGSTRQLCGNGYPATDLPLLKQGKRQDSSCLQSRHREKEELTPAKQRNNKKGKERPGK